MQPIVPGMPPAEAYAIIAAMAAAVANPQAAGGPGALHPGASNAPAPPVAGRPQAPSGAGAPPRLGASGSSAFAQYKPPQPQLCAPPVHGPPRSSISLGPGVAVPQPLRPTMPPLPGLGTSAGLPAGMQLPTTMQGFAEALKAAATAQQLQAQQHQQQQQAAPSTATFSVVAAPAAPATSGVAAGVPAAPAAGSAAPAVASGRGDATASAVSEKLKASRTRYQEKNRRAQARFRERQKAKQSEVSERMAELEARLNQLTVERDQLSVRAATLQQCLAQRQASISEHQQQESAEASGGVSDGGSGSSPKSASSADSMQKSGSGSGSRAAAQVVELREDLPTSWEEFTRWYEVVIQELAPLLAPAQTGDNPEAAARVETLWYDIIEVLGQCFMKNEGVRTRAHTGPCLPEGAAAVPPPTAELWATVTAALQLSEEQVAHMVRARREFLASLKALLQQRRALGDIICASVTKDCDSNPAVSTQHSKCLEVLHLLKRNAKEQCRLNTQLGRDMWDRLMSPLQGATACVGMYPFLPDKLAVLTVVAVRAGEPDAATLLSDGPHARRRPSDNALASDSGAATDNSNAMVSGSD